jgi:hypothetical protein
MQPDAVFTSLMLRATLFQESSHGMSLLSPSASSFHKAHGANFRKFASLAAFLIAATLLPAAIRAQQQGPLPPPASGGASGSPGMTSSSTSAPIPAAGSEAHDESEITKTPPAIPVEQIIARFSQHESEFRKERDNYTYSQSFAIQTIDFDGNPDGEYRMNSDIIFTPDGKRLEKITYAPPDSLRRITMSKQDLDDLKNIQPFVLTVEDLPKYNVTYVGRQIVDECTPTFSTWRPRKWKRISATFRGACGWTTKTFRS